jgi:hypothetical protein
MGTDTFRRHTRACVDAAIHRVFVSLRGHLFRSGFFERLLETARARSDLMAHPPARGGAVVQVEALRNLLWFENAVVREPEDWPGATGHPLCVVHSLASHLFGHYPTPRFLASVWFGKSTPADSERRRWFIALARGKSVRSLPLPVALTRRMAHELMRTPDHVGFDHALRRAEVLGLGGSWQLAAMINETRLGRRFDDGDRWRQVLQWLVGCGDAVELVQVGPVVDYLAAHLHAISLRGRTFASVMRLVTAWHAQLGRTRRPLLVWPRSRWHELVEVVPPSRDEPRHAEWTIVELTSNHALTLEGREMRHCVASYARSCLHGWSSIWSLRHRWSDEDVARPVLTIEVRSGRIVQVRGKGNARASGRALELVRFWAAREGLLAGSAHAL